MGKPNLEPHETDPSLSISPEFNIFTEKGTRAKYRDIRFTLGEKKLSGVWHYWWFAIIEGKPYGFTFLSKRKHKEMKELARAGAQKSINLMIPEVIKKGGKK